MAIKIESKAKAAAKPAGKPKPKTKARAPKPEAEAAASVKPKAAPKRKAAPKVKRQASKGGNPPKLTDPARVIEVLRASGGIRSVAAQHLNVGRTTLYAFLEKHPEVEAALEEIDEDVKDLVDTQILKAIRSGDMQTCRWFAEMKMKERGYVRRVENVGKDGGPIQHAQKMDLSNLTDEEIEIMLKAAERRESQAAQG